MAKTDAHQTAALILALAPEVSTAIEGDRQVRLRAAAKYLRSVDDATRSRLLPIVCAAMRISETVFRQIMSE